MNNLVKYIVTVLNVPLVVLFDFHQTVLLTVDLYVMVLWGIGVKVKLLHHIGNPITHHSSKTLVDKHLVNMGSIFMAKAIHIDIVGECVRECVGMCVGMCVICAVVCIVNIAMYMYLNDRCC